MFARAPAWHGVCENVSDRQAPRFLEGREEGRQQAQLDTAEGELNDPQHAERFNIYYCTVAEKNHSADSYMIPQAVPFTSIRNITVNGTVLPYYDKFKNLGLTINCTQLD
ncbi:hypothetical protein J6590_048721 [Homalodisca vitripennis]|nr:hypothetical protein J6590_048721 [Homalodisca vitripennis]